MIRTSLILSMFCPGILFASPAVDANTNPPLRQIIPEEKQMDSAWVKSLSERGESHVFMGPELAHIGMPVGGLVVD